MRDLKHYQESYQQLPFEETQVVYRKKNLLENVLKFKPRSLLEIGCGQAPFFKDYLAFDQFVVIEPCDAFYADAKQASLHDARVSVYHGTLQEQLDQLQAYRYDFILLSSLLHEIPDYKGLLFAVRQLCHAQTVVHINVPNAKSFHRLLALEMGLIDSVYETSETQKMMQQSHIFDLSKLGAAVDEMGFDVIDQGSFFIKPWTHAQMAQLQTLGMLTPQMCEGLYAMTRYMPDLGSEIFMNVKLK